MDFKNFNIYKSGGKLLLIFGFLFCKNISFAQSNPLTIKEVILKIGNNLPQLEAFRQQALAAQQNIQLAKNTAIPDLNIGYQANMATYNNITGMSYPGMIMPISGPPSSGNDWNFITGSAMGALIKWNPFTFGQRNAAIEKAIAQFKQANAIYNEQLFQYQYTAINIYLEIVYLKQLMNTQKKAITRNQDALVQSLVLAQNGLRPGIDTAQFQSVIAQSELELMQINRTYSEKLIELSRLIGWEGAATNISLIDTVIHPPTLILNDTVNATLHPTYLSLEAQKKSTLTGLKEIQNAWLPQLDFWGNLYARGSGVDAKGVVNKWDGFNLSRSNAGLGFQISFPVLGYNNINTRKKQYQFILRADESKLEQAKLNIIKQIETASLHYQQDLNIADKMPIIVKAAREVYNGLQLSYQSGLIDYARLSQAQFELLKAEYNQANANLQVARSFLAIAIAKGNLTIFLDQLK